MTLLNITGIRTLIDTYICIIHIVWLLLKHTAMFSHKSSLHFLEKVTINVAMILHYADTYTLQ